MNLRFGALARGKFNAITDVAGVRVGHCTIFADEGERKIRTGVTVIEPRPSWARLEPCFAGVHVLNGNGDATGLEWIREAGMLTTAIATTNTHSVGVVRDALVAHECQNLAQKGSIYWTMPVVLETYDGLLNDINAQHVKPEHVYQALADAATGAVAQGAVGGGHGMICHEFKGGIGTSSRQLSEADGGWTVGALVQANHGKRGELRVGGYNVGQYLTTDVVPSPFATHHLPQAGMGSIVIVIATDAPLLPHQCKRLAQRASIGLARTGGGTENQSGDIFIAFSTGNTGLPIADYAHKNEHNTAVRMVNDDHISNLFIAAADCVEEAIVNAILAAHDVTGQYATAHALTSEQLRTAMQQCADDVGR